MASSNNGVYQIVHAGKLYTWHRDTLRSPEGRAEIQRVLPAYIRALGWKATDADVAMANGVLKVLEKGTEADFVKIEQQVAEVMNTPESESQQETTEMAEATNAPQSPGLEPVRGMNEIAKTVDGKIALQRWRNGQDLDPAQSRLVEQYRAYEKQYADAADAAKPSTSARKGLNTYISRDVMAFASNQSRVQRQQLAAEHRAKVLGDMNHPYWNASSTEHKSAVLGMKIAQEMLQNGGDSSVQINPDGSIEE
jgi:hypothetical protein